MGTLYNGKGEIIALEDTKKITIDNDSYVGYDESNGAKSSQAVLLYNNRRLFPVNKSAQREYEKKIYSSGLLITLGDSYTVGMKTLLDTFAGNHGLVQYNMGMVSSKIARPEGEGSEAVKSFVTRLDELLTSFPLSVSGVSYTKNDVKLITFMGGANDWTTIDSEQGIDRIGDRYSTDKGQIYGATKYCFATLQANFPNSDIIVILQPNNNNNKDFCVMELKENVVKQCAEMYSLPICDCCFDFYSPANPTELADYWNSDKLHLNASGYQKVIDKLEVTLNSLSYYKA